MKSLLAALAPVVLLSSQANATCQINSFQSSATIVRDIGGFELGKDIREINKISKVTHWFGETYKTTKNGIEYQFDITPLGRVYAIESNQALGEFQVTSSFAESLMSKLVSKYGEPFRKDTDISLARWSISQNVEMEPGLISDTEVNWMSVLLHHDGNKKSLRLRMIDFRIAWQDQQRLNCGPVQQAQDKIKL